MLDAFKVVLLESFKKANAQFSADEQLRPEHLDLLIKIAFGQIGPELQKIQSAIIQLSEKAKANGLFISLDSHMPRHQDTKTVQKGVSGKPHAKRASEDLTRLLSEKPQTVETSMVSQWDRRARSLPFETTGSLRPANSLGV